MTDGTSGHPAAAPRPAPREVAVDLRIASDGTWYHDGGKIGRRELVKLFASVLRREADGTYWIVTPVERARVAVEDAPFVAVALEVAGDGRDRVLTFRTNLDAEVEAGPEHPIMVRTDTETGGPRPYIGLNGGMEALISRSVFYELADMAEPGPPDGDRQETALGIWSKGRFFALETEAP